VLRLLSFVTNEKVSMVHWWNDIDGKIEDNRRQCVLVSLYQPQISTWTSVGSNMGIQVDRLVTGQLLWHGLHHIKNYIKGKCVYVHNVNNKIENNIFIMFYSDTQYNRQLKLEMKHGWTDGQSS